MLNSPWSVVRSKPATDYGLRIMIRRRRRVRDIPFSFDSFLDVVANVVGIIIRLILVVWVGARSYSTLNLIGNKPATGPGGAELPAPKDPLEAELALRRRELERAREALLLQLRQLGEMQARHATLEEQ